MSKTGWERRPPWGVLSVPLFVANCSFCLGRWHPSPYCLRSEEILSSTPCGLSTHVDFLKKEIFCLPSLSTPSSALNDAISGSYVALHLYSWSQTSCADFYELKYLPFLALSQRIEVVIAPLYDCYFHDSLWSQIDRLYRKYAQTSRRRVDFPPIPFFFFFTETG